MDLPRLFRGETEMKRDILLIVAFFSLGFFCGFAAQAESPPASTTLGVSAMTAPEKSSRLPFRIREWVDKHGRVCTAVQSGANAFSAMPIAIDCDWPREDKAEEASPPICETACDEWRCGGYWDYSSQACVDSQVDMIDGTQ